MSKKNKEAFIKTAVARLNEIDPGNPSIKALEDSLRKLNSEQFEYYIACLRNGVSEQPSLDHRREILPIVVPVMSKTKISTERNMALLKKYNYEFFERIWFVDPTTKVRYLSNVPYITLELPVVRQAQTLEKKIAVSDSTTHLDDRTDQISDVSKGASFSGPELQSLLSQGYEKTALELMKYRGGDDNAFRKMTKDIVENGTFLQDSYQIQTRAKSADVAAIYLKACHFSTDL